MARFGTSYMQPPIMDPYAAMLGEEGETADGMMAPEQPPIEQLPQPMDYPRSAPPPLEGPEVVPVRNPEPYRAAAEAPAPDGNPSGVDVYRAPEYGADMDLDALRQAQETARRQQMIGGFFAAGMKDRRRGADLRQSIAQQANAPVKDLLTRRKLYRDRYEAGQEGERARLDDERKQSRTDTLNAATRQKMAKLQEEAARLEALRDPSSPESQRARETFARVAPGMADRIGDSMSAADIQELMRPGFKSELRRREIELQNEGRAEVARIKAAAKRRGGGGGGMGGMDRAGRAAYLQEEYGLDPREANMVAGNKTMFQKFMPGGDQYESKQAAADPQSLPYQDTVALRMFAQDIVKGGGLRVLQTVRKAQENFDAAGVNVPKKLLAEHGGNLGRALLDDVSPEFSQFKQELASLTNVLLKERSGAAVTAQEYARFMKEMGVGAVRDPKRVQYWMRRLEKAISDDFTALASGMSDKGVNELIRRIGPSVPMPESLQQRAERYRRKRGASAAPEASATAQGLVVRDTKTGKVSTKPVSAQVFQQMQKTAPGRYELAGGE